MNNSQNNDFSYTYSAREQAELKKIREKYCPSEESTMDKIRRLDARVNKTGAAWAISIGGVGSIVLGGGMSLCMVGPEQLFIPGIIVGVLGIVIVSLAYPIYNLITKKEREKIAPEILRLTDELMKK